MAQNSKSKKSSKSTLMICSFPSGRQEFIHDNSPQDQHSDSSTSYYNTNIHAFFQHTTPTLPSSDYSMKHNLWDFFDEPYGLEVPVVLSGIFSKRRKEVEEEVFQRHSDTEHDRLGVDHVYFVPHLSGFYMKLERREVKERKVLDTVVYKHFESKQPSERNYFNDEIEHLSQTICPLLNSDEPLSEALKHFKTDSQQEENGEWTLSESSFFSILWVPILCHNATQYALNGEILCYYSFQPSTNFVRGIPNKEKSESKSTASHQLFAPLIGFAPYKVRNDTWFKNIHPNPFSTHDEVHHAPLKLVANVPALLKELNIEEEHFDYGHIRSCLQIEKECR